ncbi:MAG: hypothetical protein JSS66_12620 [Armatimonadetes bacterium]|nr:hypothetical protein [Armatimonadota bacterium]
MALTQEQEQARRLRDVDAFVDFLRRERNFRDDDAPFLADKFGLDHELVRHVLNGLGAPSAQRTGYESFLKAISCAFDQFLAKLKDIWLVASGNAMVFVLASAFLGVAVAYFLQIPALGLAPVSVSNAVNNVLWLIVALQMACFARHGRMRYPLYAGAILAGMFVLGSSKYMLETLHLGLGRLVSLGLTVGFFYAGLGSAAALVGGYVAMGRRARTRVGMTRQEALERLLVVRDLLERRDDFKPQRQLKTWIDRSQEDPRWPLAALLGGLALGALRVLVLGGYAHVFRNFDLNQDPVLMTLRIMSVIVTAIGFLGIGFLAGGVRKALFSQGLAFVGFEATNFIRLGMFGPDLAMQQLQLPYLAPVVLLLLVSGLLSGIGARIEDATKRERRLDENDPAALLAERIVLERRLNAPSGASCVVSIDVAQSTLMKEGQDRLKVEWSFREFQKFLTEVCEQSGGHIVSTAGDGAIATFCDSEDALNAARDAQTRIAWFNSRVNRLDSPFRVRVGIHCDEVQGEVNDVQFTQVIDIAAHVQTRAPVGGILVTAEATVQLPEEEFTELKDPVQGHKVFVVANPTLSA